jgi:hypothetical protein
MRQILGLLFIAVAWGTYYALYKELGAAFPFGVVAGAASILIAFRLNFGYWLNFDTHVAQQRQSPQQGREPPPVVEVLPPECWRP